MVQHRPLSQQLNYDQDDDKGSDHALLRSLPETSAKARSKSNAAPMGGIPQRSKVQGSGEDGESFISHSPYLLSYSPRREGVASTGARGERSGSERDGKSSKWGFQKLRSASSASSKASDMNVS